MYTRSPINTDLTYLRVSHKASSERIDEKNGIIYGLSLVTVGQAKGHDVWLDESFVKAVAAKGSASVEPIKACAGHANMSTPSFGQQLGVFKNFRLSEDKQKCLADLHLLEAAKYAPDGNFFDYTIVLAKTNPDLFGVSIVFLPGQSYYYNAKGQVVNGYKNPADVQCDEKGNPKVYATIVALSGADLVDDPAANPAGAFSASFSGKSFAVQASAFIQQHPLIARMIRQDAKSGFAKCISFLRKFSDNSDPNKEDHTPPALTNSMSTPQMDFEQKILDLQTVLQQQVAAFSQIEKRLAALEQENVCAAQQAEVFGKMQEQINALEQAMPLPNTFSAHSNIDVKPIENWKRLAFELTK